MSIVLPSIYPVACHTDNVGSGTTFVAIKGTKLDGVTFINSAIQKGATTVVVAHDTVLPAATQQLIKERAVVLLYVANTRKALAQLSAQAAGYPARKLKIIGVTGTKGKTTTSSIMHHIIEQSGRKAALLTTAGNKIGSISFSAPLTTAQPDYLHQFLKQCVKAGVEYVVMEVAAQAVTLYRVYGIEFVGIIFTNFGLEHLEFYADMESYFAAKAALLSQRTPSSKVVLNGDDQRCALLAEHEQHAITFGYCQSADYIIQPVALQHEVNFMLSLQGRNTIISCPALIGSFNMYNVASAVIMAMQLGISVTASVAALQTFAGVTGRFEKYQLPNGALCIIDYAHNPLSYQALLPVLRSMTSHLIVIFGAGGCRDASRRPLMGALAVQYADLVVLTNDNPRTEDPQRIMEDIYAGIAVHDRHKVELEFDRALAIQKAYAHSRSGTIIALLGKGGDEYQIIGAQVTFFSDARQVQALQ
jgi:UDP-N-acetylmuramoyl-L-alanyl-D-glutamate--2,6-diaminopimelate ligase